MELHVCNPACVINPFFGPQLRTEECTTRLKESKPSAINHPITHMDSIILYALGLICCQIVQTLEDKRAIPHLKQLIADMQSASRRSWAAITSKT